MATLPEFDACATYSGPVVLRLDTVEIEARQVAHGNVNGNPVVRLVPTEHSAKVLATLNNQPSGTLVYPLPGSAPLMARPSMLLRALATPFVVLFESLVLPIFPSRLQTRFWKKRLSRLPAPPRLPVETLEVFHALWQLGQVEAASGALTEAAEHLRAALDTRRTAFAMRPRDGYYLLNYAEVLLRLGRTAEARTILTEITSGPVGTERISVMSRKMAEDHLRRLSP